MRILLIAPDYAKLLLPNFSTELEEIGRKHQITAITGKVDHKRLLIVTTGQKFDAVHFACHGDDDALLLSKGHMLNKEQLGQMVRHVRANLVFLNACRSAALATYLSDLGVPVVAAWTKSVLDADGARTAIYFYDELAENPDLRAAYNKVSPRDGSLLFLTSEGYISDLILPLLQNIDSVNQLVSSLRKHVGQFIYALVILIMLISAVGYLAFVSSSTSAAEVKKIIITPESPAANPTEIPLATPSELPTAIPTDTLTSVPTTLPMDTATAIPIKPPMVIPTQTSLGTHK
jgi:CHAT domain